MFCSEKDAEHIQKLGNLIGAIGRHRQRINDYSKRLCNHYEMCCRDVFYGKKLFHLLQLHLGSKTYRPPNLEWLNSDDKFLSFFLGFCDGDGCIAKNKYAHLKIEIHLNWLNTLKEFQSRLRSLGIKSSVTTSSRGFALMRITKVYHVAALKKFGIKNHLPIMARKWDSLDENIILRRDIFKTKLPEIKALLSTGVSNKQACAIMNMGQASWYINLKKYRAELLAA